MTERERWISPGLAALLQPPPALDFAAEDGRAGASGWDPLPPGVELVPGYQVVAHLRRGVDLDVYDLWSSARCCRCVGKTMRPDQRRNHHALSRLLREGLLLQRLTHPHLVRAYETVRVPLPVVILETLPGATLDTLVEELAGRGRRLSVHDLAFLGLHLCSAVHYLHRQGILHLDLKPSNIICSQGLAKLLDLSVARTPGVAPEGIGTPGYMAPEQVRGGLLTPAVDCWGIGSVLYYAATAHEPFPRVPEQASEALACLRQGAPSIRRLRRLPAVLSRLIERCLAYDPAQRPEVAEVSQELEALLAPAAVVT